jgi:hypothetical protein
MADRHDKLARAYARLLALKEHVPPGAVEHIYVAEFHAALDHCEQVGLDVAEFRVPEGQIRPQLRSSNTHTGEKTYSEERYAPSSLFRTKLDAFLTYFELAWLPELKRGAGATPAADA